MENQRCSIENQDFSMKNRTGEVVEVQQHGYLTLIVHAVGVVPVARTVPLRPCKPQAI